MHGFIPPQTKPKKNQTTDEQLVLQAIKEENIICFDDVLVTKIDLHLNNHQTLSAGKYTVSEHTAAAIAFYKEEQEMINRVNHLWKFLSGTKKTSSESKETLSQAPLYH